MSFKDRSVSHLYRLDLQHYAIQHASGTQYFAPIEDPIRAIDIGTGTGTWMMVSVWAQTVSHGTLFTQPHRKWQLISQDVTSLASTLHHYNRPQCCLKTAASSLLMYLKVGISILLHYAFF
jgi:hypothetical protein